MMEHRNQLDEDFTFLSGVVWFTATNHLSTKGRVVFSEVVEAVENEQIEEAHTDVIRTSIEMMVKKEWLEATSDTTWVAGPKSDTLIGGGPPSPLSL